MRFVTSISWATSVKESQYIKWKPGKWWSIKTESMRHWDTSNTEHRGQVLGWFLIEEESYNILSCPSYPSDVSCVVLTKSRTGQGIVRQYWTVRGLWLPPVSVLCMTGTHQDYTFYIGLYSTVLRNFSFYKSYLLFIDWRWVDWVDYRYNIDCWLWDDTQHDHSLW